MSSNYIVSKYPELFDHDDFIEVSVGEGWFKLVEDICQIITERNVDKQRDVLVYQVKPKFGRLRFYCTGITDYEAGVIDLAEKLSGKTCEVCGCIGGVVNLDGYYTARCKLHENDDE